MAHAPFKYNPWEMSAEERDATFVGRRALLAELLTAVREQQGRGTVQHYMLLGPRGIGKTTLLLMLRDAVRSDPAFSRRWLCVQFREEEFYVSTLRDLLVLALEGLYADENVPEAGLAHARAEEEMDDEKSLAIAVDALREISSVHGRQILLLIDNFDRVFPRKRNGRNTRARDDYRPLRKLLSTQPHLMVIGASVRVFEDIAAYDEALFNFFSPVYVQNLSDDQIAELLCARAERDGNTSFVRDFEQMRSKVRAVTAMTGGNPRLILMLYEILSRRAMLPVVQALRDTIDNLTPLLKDVLEDLPRQQSKTLDALMRLGGVASPARIAQRARLSLNTITTQLGRLKDLRFVECESAGKGGRATYRVADQMFRTWYQMRYLRPARRRIELFVEFLRAWFSVEERTELLRHGWDRFAGHAAAESAGQARQTLLDLEYYAASAADPTGRRQELERVYDAYLAVGEPHEAALGLAELHAQPDLPRARYEAAGYAALAERLKAKGDLEEAIRHYSTSLEKAPDNVAARRSLALCYGLSGGHTSALEHFSIVAQREDIDPATRANALCNCGVARAMLGDADGAIQDYSAAIELEVAPPDQVARALYNRGASKRMLGNAAGASQDYGAVVELEGARPDQVVRALNNLGALYGGRGDYAQALDSFERATRTPGVSGEMLCSVLRNRAVAHEHLGNVDAALADFEACLEGPETVHDGLRGLVRVLLGEGRADEAVARLGRMSELEPADASMERRVEARIEIVREAAGTASLEAAEQLLRALLESDPAELRERLQFLQPALELARTGDAEVLRELPPEEREAAKRIAESLGGESGRGETAGGAGVSRE